MNKPVRIAITGAAGQISYSLMFRIASGAMLGLRQPVILQLIEIPPALPALAGTVMELHDCAFPLLHDVVSTSDADEGFGDVDYALLVGAKPRGAGMQRGDLILDNAPIFQAQGAALNRSARRTVRILVVGNPANTNALVALHNAPDLAPQQFTAMTRLDHNRAVSLLAARASVHCTEVRNMIIWGNHSATQYPDVRHARIGAKPARKGRVDEAWLRDEFIPQVQNRGAEVIKARGASSAASAASAALDHMRDWVQGTPGDDWVSMGVVSDGSYGIAPGVIFSYPVTCASVHDGGGYGYEVVQDLTVDEFSRAMLDASDKELRTERDAVRHLL